MAEKEVVYKTSFPVLGVLGLIFVTLKLMGIGAVATWPWLWVLAPFWVPFALALAIVLIALIVGGIIVLLAG